MALIGSKLCQNAFQVIPDVSFFDAGNKKKQKKLRTLKVRLPLEDGSDRPETCLTSKTEKISDFSVAIILSWPGHMCLGPRHMCPGHDNMIATEKSENFSIFDVKK